MMRRRTFLLGSVALPIAWQVTQSRSANSPQNEIKVIAASIGGTRNHPVRIARPFVRGEIQGVPQAVQGGKLLPTQADIKMRWPDGSVKHAILSFVVPETNVGGSVSVSFVNQNAIQNTPMSVDQMLDPQFDFDATIEIVRDNQTQRVSAREMLKAGNFSVWCAGPIATTVVIADHSAARKYDFGFESTRPIRPIFHATFWPALKKVFVRVIAENCCTEAMQDVNYALVVKSGLKRPVEQFRQDLVPHSAATRWTRRFWIGSEPDSDVSIDHNLAYLVRTFAFPNYDSSLEVRIGRSNLEMLKHWEVAPKNLYEHGMWARHMSDPGGRPDIGPYTHQEVLWLYTGDKQFFDLISQQAELAAAWPLHVREGNSAKKFDSAGKISALGRPISVFARPTSWPFDSRDESKPQDRIVVHGERIKYGNPPELWGGWHADGAHQPDPYSALYTLTGDYFALEQLQLWASSTVFHYPPTQRGEGGAAGEIWDEVRGCAWAFRNRVHAAYLSPDGTPEKSYFERMVNDAIAAWEGAHDIHGTTFEGTPRWRSGNLKRFPAFKATPLHFFRENTDWMGQQKDNGGLIAARTGSAEQMWQHYYLIFALGLATERGFPSGALLSYAGALLTGQFREPATYSPFNVMRIHTAIRDKNGQFYKTWTETLAAYVDPSAPKILLDFPVDENYASYPYGASSFLTKEPGGQPAYDWLRKNFYEPFRDKFAEHPKWCFVPRV